MAHRKTPSDARFKLDRFITAFQHEYAPATPIEHHLVERLAFSALLYRRYFELLAEAADRLYAGLNDPNNPAPTEDQQFEQIGQMVLDDCADRGYLNTVNQQASAALRSFLTTQRTLTTLQKL